jgi:hypothetical protein
MLIKLIAHQGVHFQKLKIDGSHRLEEMLLTEG